MTRQTLGQVTLTGMLTLMVAAAAASVKAQGIPVLGAGDTAIAIDADGKTANGRYPTAESPSKSIDGATGSKYLNFGGKGSGFIVTPAAATPVESFQIRTGNDAPGRDPASWELYGFNGALITTDSGPNPAINASGEAEAWTLIDSGAVNLPGDPTLGNDQRGVLGPVVDVNPGGVGYQHYKIMFPTLKVISDPIMQIDEIQFYGDDAASAGQAILAPSNPVIAVHYGHQSRYPGGEAPDRVLDGLANTKYLNFGRENTGLIFTNDGGAVQLLNMSLTTANDVADRDPASFELWGTNDSIQTANNTDGNGGETWTLITSGPLSLPGDIATDDFRGETAVVPINATASYSSYKLVFPTVKNLDGANSMQIADVQLFAIPEPASAALALAGVLVGCCLRRKG
ncbi:MAG TPA: hypothetical protein VF175_06590 [Lacipirellula sp.]